MKTQRIMQSMYTHIQLAIRVPNVLRDRFTKSARERRDNDEKKPGPIREKHDVYSCAHSSCNALSRDALDVIRYTSFFPAAERRHAILLSFVFFFLEI